MYPAASVPGNALLGYLTDRWPVSIAVFASSAATALSCLFFWGFGTHDGILVTFAIIYGLLGLSFSALWVRMIGAIASRSFTPRLIYPCFTERSETEDDPTAPQIIFPIFAFLRGVGNISSGMYLVRIRKVKPGSDTLRTYIGCSAQAGYIPGRSWSLWSQQLCESNKSLRTSIEA